MNDTYESFPLDLTRVLADPDPSGKKPRKNEQPRNDRPEGQTLDDALFLACKRAVDEKKPVEFKAAIHNTDRTVGARLAGYIAQKYTDTGLKDKTVVATFEGSAGQSFGAFCINGMQLNVYGEANDYVDDSDDGEFWNWGVKAKFKLWDDMPFYATLDYQGGYYDATTEDDTVETHALLAGISFQFGPATLKDNDRYGATLDMPLLPSRAASIEETLD